MEKIQGELAMLGWGQAIKYPPASYYKIFVEMDRIN